MRTASFEPSYLALHRSGELRRRAEFVVEELAACCACPRDCGIDRLADETAVCKTGRYARVASYFPHRGEEDCEMYRQVGDLVFDEEGLARRGLMVRHLVMAGRVAGSTEILRFLAEEISARTYVNVMDQYYPAGKVGRDPKYDDIARATDQTEYKTAVDLAREAGLRIDTRDGARGWMV